MMIRRLGIILVSAVLVALLLNPGSVPKASAQEEEARISASMKSYCYAPGELAYLGVDLKIPEAMRAEPLELDLLVYSSASTRSHLTSFKEGARRYPIIRRNLDTIQPDGEWTAREYEIDLNSLGLNPGVYPFEIRMIQGSDSLSSDDNFLVIMEPGAGYPLNLALLWTIHFLPAYDAQGNQLDGGLASACSSSSSETGFLYDLARVLKQTPEVKSSMILPFTTYQDLESLASKAGEDEGGDTASGAAQVLRLLDEMFASGQVDLLTTSYSFADIDYLSGLGWEETASEQMQEGIKAAGEMGSTSRGFIAPLYRLGDGLLQRIVQNEFDFTVVGEEALQSSAAGRRLLEGTTLSQPVKFVNENGYLLKAFVRDEALYSYLEDATQGDTPHMVQSIIAELAVLQRESPYEVRSCVLAYPPNFMPSRDFLEGLYEALKGCAWLNARSLSDLNKDQFSLEGVALQAPVNSVTPSSYSQKLDDVRKDAYAYSLSLPADNPVLEDLSQDILIAENYRFMEEKDVVAAQKYLDSINAVIQDEISKVRIERKRSVTLSSTQGNFAVDITSDLGYPIEATLRVENTSLTFPEGRSMNVTIEPRENSFMFSVNTHRKGSFMVDIVLEANGLLVDSTSTTVNTSIINSLAVILLIGLACMVALVFVIKRLSRKYHSGKHTRGRAKQ